MRTYKPLHFISTYMEYCKKQSKGSEHYRRGLAIASLGSALGRKSRYDLTTPVYHNFYVCILGASSLTHKTTALRQASNLIEDKDLLPSLFSVEMFLEVLSENSEGILVEDEFGSLMKKMTKKNSYMGAMLDHLNSLYDCPSRYKIQFKQYKNKNNILGEKMINDAYLTFLTATTPEALLDYATNEFFEGGMYPRFLILYDNHAKYDPLEEIQPEERLKAQQELDFDILKLKNKFNELRKIKFRFTWNDDARAEQIEYTKNKFDKEKNEELVPYHSIIARHEQYIYKVADILALDESIVNVDEDEEALITVQLRHVKAAIEFIDRCLEDSIRIKKKAQEERILSKINRVLEDLSQPISHPELLKKSQLIRKDFQEGVLTLIESWKMIIIECDSVDYPTLKRSTDFYCTPIKKEHCKTCLIERDCSHMVWMKGHDEEFMSEGEKLTRKQLENIEKRITETETDDNLEEDEFFAEL